ncbi:unnamed protein product [Cylindrotheca closterium]|uniref:non-specific serine/threonine protein kinase n=1 Tax=Cylindrotheca closterium TaxID=2856 RepID=A0AAD2CG07_9STRA|nr:unnamed protein product [Cylindrotheca closterium]
MGASHTTLASSNKGFDEGPPELDGEVLGAYAVEKPLFPASGRMMRTFQLRHKQNLSTIVLKTMVVTSDVEKTVTKQQEELKRIRAALKGQHHVAPFLFWSTGNYKPKPGSSTMVRQIHLLRPHTYTTLSDRLASRPFLTHVEKLWISFQILEALEAMHSANVVHGFLTTENIGLSSWNWVVLVDFASYKARTALPDDDPSDYLYYFQELYKNGSDTTPRDKRCYLAPERFFTPKSGEQQQDHPQPPLTPAMDIFSAGCVILETFLNGERALDLGDLMEYRKDKSSQTLQQGLNKIEFSALRAACRHMLHLDPTERLSAGAYLERLHASSVLPASFRDGLSPLMEKITHSPPDARLAIAAAHYYSIVWATAGLRDEEGKRYFEKALGYTMTKLEGTDQPESGESKQDEAPDQRVEEEKKEEITDFLAETEALLRKLDSLNFEDEILSLPCPPMDSVASLTAEVQAREDRSEISQSSLLIYLQSILSTVRYVQRPASKIVALQLMIRVAKYVSDEARLQRIVPVTITLLNDQDPLVRASAIEVLSATLSIVDSFPPSDSKIFPQYIFKRVTHLMTDPSLVVRLVFARNLASLAETSHRFLDISHAVQLYEAVGGGGSRSPATGESAKEESLMANDVFADDITKLLDNTTGSGSASKSRSKQDSDAEASTQRVAGAGKTLISSNYKSEIMALHETISRCVVHITTDQSEHSSPVKRALLSDMARLCNFFGLDGVMAFILPQLLTFLNDRRDWQLRAALFEHLPSVCHIIGRAATEHFVIPCLETGLVDGEEAVVTRALQSLAQLSKFGLLSRSILLGTSVSARSGSETPGLLKKYAPLLVHPSVDVRFFAIKTFNAVCQTLDSPDSEVFIVPIIEPFLRYQPSPRHLVTPDGLESCLHPAWTRDRFNEELSKYIPSSGNAISPSIGWTSISLQTGNCNENRTKSGGLQKPEKTGKADTQIATHDNVDVQTEQVTSYLKMLARSRTYTAQYELGAGDAKAQLVHAIEGPLKLAQQIKFPSQDNPSSREVTIPAWYNTLRETYERQDNLASETSAIRSVSALGQVYGLSIMDQSATGASASSDMSSDRAVDILRSNESRMIQAACSGEWGAETNLDPALSDTTLLVTKLNALKVPPLPPKLSENKLCGNKVTVSPQNASNTSNDNSGSFKRRIDTVVATSRTASKFGHTGPVVRLVVANDQRFFSTGSHDGTCRIWELEKAEKCNGVLESSVTYSGHLTGNNSPNVRINDLVVLEGSHSVCSAASDGSIHTWRVEMVSSSKQSAPANDARSSSRAVGSTIIRQMNPDEGEVLALNHFNTSSASLLTYATQKGYVHSWDLRSASEPFLLQIPNDTGYITSCTVGSDRNWVVTGTSRGYLALWDLRFQQILKLWHHSRSTAIHRLGTSIVPAPQSWTGKSRSEMRPFLFAAAGPNECAMFDITNGACRECFRTVDYSGRYLSPRVDEIPRLDEISVSPAARRREIASRSGGAFLAPTSSVLSPSINAMVGSIGASSHSFLLTGGSDGRLRFWDFAVPSKCYASSGLDGSQPRPSFERIDYPQSCRLMLCRQPPKQHLCEVESSRVPKALFQGLKKPENYHRDSIQDLKVVRSGLLSCSRDCTVKLWR